MSIKFEHVMKFSKLFSKTRCFSKNENIIILIILIQKMYHLLIILIIYQIFVHCSYFMYKIMKCGLIINMWDKMFFPRTAMLTETFSRYIILSKLVT